MLNVEHISQKRVNFKEISKNKITIRITISVIGTPGADFTNKLKFVLGLKSNTK